MSKSVAFNNPRLTNIERFIVQRQQVSVADICEVFGISEATARRDLDQIASTGSIQRVHGGAIAKNEAPPEPPVLQRASWQQNEKQRIAALAAMQIDAGDTVFISSGTTSLAVAQELSSRNDLTIVTNSLPVMNVMADSQNAMIALGGMLRASESSFIGHLAVQGLAELRINKIIFGIRGIDVVHGLTNDYLPETVTDRAILSAGRQVIVVADHTKLGRTAPAFVAPLSSVHTLITDHAANPTVVDAISAIGVRVLLA